MKKLISAFFLTVGVAQSLLASSCAATQNWVRDYVSTHAVTNDVRATDCRISSSVASGGTNYTFAFTLSFASDPSWKIVESSVTGMVAGTQFAFDGFGNACNYTNAACNVIYQSVSTNCTFVTKGVTNVRDTVRLDFCVNGVPFRGYEDPRHRTVLAAGVSNLTGTIRFRRSCVTPRIKAILTTPPASLSTVSWLELFFPTAHAAWIQGAEWTCVNTYTEGDTTYKDWELHYFWDGEALSADISSLSVGKSGGGTISYDTSATYDIPGIGDGDYCGRSTPSVPDIVEAVKMELYGGASGLFGSDTLTAKIFKDMLLKGKFDSQLTSAIENALAPYQVTLDCPQKTTTESSNPAEDPPKPDIPEGCYHANIVCNSDSVACRFRCAVCGLCVYSGTHSFGEAENHCAVCTYAYNNRGKSIPCGVASECKGDHLFGSWGGDDAGCRCKKGRIWSPHGETTYVDGQWQYNGDNHWKLKECSVCGYDQIKGDLEKHYLQFTTPIYVDESRCSISNVCWKCGYSAFVEDCGHVNPGLVEHAWVDNSCHTNFYTCTKCLHAIGTGVSAHVSDGKYVHYEDSGESGHSVQLQCKSGFDGCGEKYWKDSVEPHHAGSAATGYETVDASASNTYHYVLHSCTNCNHAGIRGEIERCSSSENGPRQIYLVDDASEKDYYKCNYCESGRGELVPHTWSWTAEEHWCSNDSSQKHLEGEHVFVANVCTVCGYAKGSGEGDKEYKSEGIAVDCKCGQCCGGSTQWYRFKSTNGVEIAEALRGEWTFYQIGDTPKNATQCRYLSGNSCVCPFCRGDSDLLFDDCYCGHINAGEILSFCDSIISTTYHLRYVGSAALLVDFSDPVYDVGASCFEEAFVSMPNLSFVNASTITNVGAYAFARAFTNSARLAEVNFESLRNAGNNAFEDAFVGCSLASGVSLSELRTCGSGCFSGAFRNTRIGSVSFPSLTDAGTHMADLFDGVPCATLTSLSAPKLDFEFSGARMFDFETMPNLAKADFRSVSTNVFNAIGDLSKLAKLQRLDLHCMTGVPLFQQSGGGFHAPTNNPNCMIVVPDELWPVWVCAPGWSDLWAQIVPYSNQVIRPIVTVSFDTGWGATQVPSTNIVNGLGIVAPTNGIVKYTSEYNGPDGAFTFAGWYCDSEKTNPYTNGTPITASTTLYAKWTDNGSIVAGTNVYDIAWDGSTTYAVTNIAYATIGANLVAVEGWIKMYYTDGITTNKSYCYLYNPPFDYTTTGDISGVQEPSNTIEYTCWYQVENDDPENKTKSNTFTVRIVK